MSGHLISCVVWSFLVGSLVSTDCFWRRLSGFGFAIAIEVVVAACSLAFILCRLKAVEGERM